MISKKVSRSDFEASTFIASQSTILSMHALKVVLINNFFEKRIDFKSPIDVKFDHRVIETRIPEPGVLEVILGIDVIFDFEEEHKSKNNTDPIIKIEIEYLNRYEIPSGPMPEGVEDVAIPAFAKINAVIQCWPYFRQLVSKLTTEIGYPFILPILVLETESEDSSG